jgi:beta-glucosidase
VSTTPDLVAAPAEFGFGPSFIWGAATSAYQIEGAVEEDGRGTSIWDSFTRVEGAVLNGDSGDVATDHYHLFSGDVALMREIGINAYRFSISWPRVQPSGSGPPNQKGLDFYRRLVDELLDKGITPFATLYHWDLPQELEDLGGWPNRDTAERFGDYALLVGEALSDRVTNWMTLNEPWCAAFLGYSSGIHAPGRTDETGSIKAAHNLLLGHGRAVESLHSAVSGATIALTLNLAPITPATGGDEDVAAARLIDGLLNRLFLEPVLLGSYPEDMIEHFSKICDMSFVTAEDLNTIAVPIDALGVNYYHGHTVRHGSRVTGPTSWPGAQHVHFVEPTGPTTAMDWPIQSQGLVELLRRLDRDYPRIPLYITENGAAFHDYVRPDGSVNDPDRVHFLDEHVHAVNEAISDGVEVRGYFVWSLLDNFEWSWGYSKRFGLVHVDFATQHRIMKASAHWYRDFIKRHKSSLARRPAGRELGRGDGHRNQPTLEKVAELAGVSRATASRVVNASPGVSERARASVERAIKQLGYVPNRAARSLVTRRSDTVALVVPATPARFFADPFFAGIVRGVTQILADSPFQLVLSIPQSAEQNERFEQYVLNGHTDGVIVVSFPVDNPLVEELVSASVPAVLCGRPGRDLDVSYVDADNCGGARAAVSYLLESGRRRIATITGPADTTPGLDRCEGYRSALTKAALELDPSLEAEGDFSQSSGQRAMAELLERHPDVDAVFAASDLMAAGALRALTDAGRRVPEDVAVVGFDDSQAAVLASPKLSTVRQPIEAMGRELANMLLNQITSGESAPKKLVLDTKLILREST